jgi:Phage Tail Collar Domain
MEVDMQFLRRHRPTPALVISVVALVVALGGVASATIPGDNGEIHACYNAQGALRVIDPAGGGSCPAGDKSLSWNAGEGLGRDTGTAAAGEGADCTMGQMILTAGNVANGMPARGELLQINHYQALFSLIGTTYGGDGRTTFALPDLRKITPANMTWSICDRGMYPRRR